MKIIQGNCLDVLRTLPDASVQCCVTSPPYWGLRDYSRCGCIKVRPRNESGRSKVPRGGHAPETTDPAEPYQTATPDPGCRRCGGTGKIDMDSDWPTGWRGCHGLEPTLEMYVQHAVLIFREVRRCLRGDGTLWLNLGDAYTSGGRATFRSGASENKGHQTQDDQPRPNIPAGLKPKDQCGIPWRVAFALQADGWWLRQDIIWAKPNPMPESVTDRCTKSHEYLFLLTKSQRYHFDAESIKEPVTGQAHDRGHGVNPKAYGSVNGWDNSPSGAHTQERVEFKRKANGPNSRMVRERTPLGDASKPNPSRSNIRPKQNESFSGVVTKVVTTRNKRSVWTIPTQACSDAHFATFPEDLVKPCILAGCPVGGTVLDPFFGSGTVGRVATELGRECIGIELNPEYIEIARGRCNVTSGLKL